MYNFFTNFHIKDSVGIGGLNKPSDVIIIQRLLNESSADFKGRGAVTPDGIKGKNTFDAIKNFQQTVVGFHKPDGKVSPGGKTFNKLIEVRDPRIVAKHNKASFKFQPALVDTHKFLKLYSDEFGRGKGLSKTAKEGLSFLLRKIMADPDIVDLRWAAYMLATVKHECSGTYTPIEELGKGNYYSKRSKKQVVKEYSKVFKVKDPETGKERENVYYGRGYVQLTWDYNYRNIGKALGYGDKLYIKPELALDPDIAYAVMSYGMRDGTFTDYSLKDCIIGVYADYKSARKIINGTDQAELIKGYAQSFESLIILSSYHSRYYLKPFETMYA